MRKICLSFWLRLFFVIYFVGIMFGCSHPTSNETESLARESIVLLTPPNRSEQSLTFTFRWSIKNKRPGVVYCSDVITDKELNPFDGNFLEIFHAKQDTQLTVSLNPFRYTNPNSNTDSFFWGVLITACADINATCQDTVNPCQGKILQSEVGLVFLKSESVLLLAPPDKSQQGLTVTFRWSIKNKRTGVIYCSDIITDKGVNPFDGHYEQFFYAGQDTQKTVNLNSSRYDNATFQWGVLVTACADANAICDSTKIPPCQGKKFESQIWNLSTKM